MQVPTRAQDIFSRALECSPDERAAFLRSACRDDERLRADVESLLRAYEDADGFLCERPSNGAVEGPGTVIGRYRLVEVLGEGAFAVVWSAEQLAPLQREVALKIVRVGMDTAQVVARFAVEQRALARMDHPDIARVLDAGTTASGRPFFAMEIVRGTPITTWCASSAVPLRQRLRLFVRVCLAVHHAHQKGVIHRDLKPTNVLVTVQHGEPAPKVIDFGIAKALDPERNGPGPGERPLLGTPEYMAPEQIDGGTDVDTRADVYSLGALLYELLTGTPPFDVDDLVARGEGELLRHLCRVDPPRPSERPPGRGGVAQARLRGELDWICARALHKDRERRYASASDLAMDVERHLQDQPVLAGPQRASYRLLVFARRNRVLALAAAAILLALVAGLFAALAALDRARRAESAASTQAGRAQRDARRLRAVQDFLQDEMLGAVSPRQAGGPGTTVREVLDGTAASLRSGALGDVPEVKADIHRHIGRLYRELGALQPAEEHLRAAVALRRALPEPAPADLAADLRSLADCLLVRGDAASGAAAIAEGLELCRGRAGAQRTRADLLMLRGFLALSDGRNGDAEADFLAAEALYAAPGTHDAGLLPSARHNLAVLAAARGDDELALRLHEEALALLRQSHGEDHIRVARAEGDIGMLLLRRGDLDGAERRLRREVEVCERVLPADHMEIAQALDGLAGVLQAQGRLPEALATERRALSIFARALGPHHDLVANAHNNVGGCLEAMGEEAAAEAAFREALAAFAAAPNPQPARMATTCYNLGSLLRKRGELAEAETLLDRCVAGRRAFFGAGHPALAEPLYWLGDVRRGLGRLDAAAAAFAEAVEVLRAETGAEERLAAALAAQGKVASDRGDWPRAEAALREAVALRQRACRPGDWLVPYTEGLLGHVLARAGRPAEAEPLLTAAAERLDRAPGPARLAVLRALAELYTDWQRPIEAAQWRAEAERLEAATGGGSHR